MTSDLVSVLTCLLAMATVSSFSVVSRPPSFLPSSLTFQKQHQPFVSSSSTLLRSSTDEESAKEEETASTTAVTEEESEPEEAAPEEAAPEEAAATEEAAAAVAEPPRKIERERHTAFVGNIPFEVSESDLKDLFAQHGKVELVKIPRDRDSGLVRGFAFVDMGSAEELNAAVENLNESLLTGRKIYVNVSEQNKPGEKKKQRNNTKDALGESKKLYVGNIPFDSTEDEIFDLFAEFGEVLVVQIPRHADSGRGRGFAFITVKAEDEDKFLDASQDLEYDGRVLVVNKPLPMGAKKVNKKRIYIGNMSFYTVPETLEEIFSEFGEVLDIYMPTDRVTGAPRGFGFVTMPDEVADDAIAALDGCEVDGRIITVNEAQKKERRGGNNNADADADTEESAPMDGGDEF